MAWNSLYTNNPELLAVASFMGWQANWKGNNNNNNIIKLSRTSSMVNNRCLHCCACLRKVLYKLA